MRDPDRFRSGFYLAPASIPKTNGQTESRDAVQVVVRDNNVDQALRALKKKMQREGIFREMKLRNYYEKPSEKRAREKAEAIRRARKLARKKAQRERRRRPRLPPSRAARAASSSPDLVMPADRHPVFTRIRCAAALDSGFAGMTCAW